MQMPLILLSWSGPEQLEHTVFNLHLNSTMADGIRIFQGVQKNQWSYHPMSYVQQKLYSSG